MQMTQNQQTPNSAETDHISKTDMTFLEHASQLKTLLVYSACEVVAMCVLCFIGQEKIFDFVMSIGIKAGFNFIFISPEELVVQKLNLVVLSGFLCTLPILVIQLCQFVSDGLAKKIRKLALLYCMFALILYTIGMVFSIKLLLPYVYKFMLDVNTSSSITASLSVAKFVTFTTRITLALGLLFEMPVVCSILAFCRLITANTLRRIRSYVIVIIFIVAAVITPPDVVSQCFVAVPMLALYEFSIILVAIITKLTKQV